MGSIPSTAQWVKRIWHCHSCCIVRSCGLVSILAWELPRATSAAIKNNKVKKKKKNLAQTENNALSRSQYLQISGLDVWVYGRACCFVFHCCQLHPIPGALFKSPSVIFPFVSWLAPSTWFFWLLLGSFLRSWVILQKVRERTLLLGQSGVQAFPPLCCL